MAPRSTESMGLSFWTEKDGTWKRASKLPIRGMANGTRSKARSISVISLIASRVRQQRMSSDPMRKLRKDIKAHDGVNWTTLLFVHVGPSVSMRSNKHALV